MKKVVGYISLGLFIFLTVIFISKDFLIKLLATPIASHALGAKVSIGDFSLDLGKSILKVKDLQLDSPQGYGEDPIVDVASLEVHYDLNLILKKKYHFNLIDLNIRNINLVKNKEGLLNVQALKPAAQHNDAQEVKPASSTTQASAQPKQDIDLYIGTLKLNVDRFTMKDNRSTPASIENVDIGFHHQTFKEIKSVTDLTMRVIVSQVNLRALTNTAFMATGKVKKGIGFIFDTTTGVVGEAGGLLKNIANKL